MKKLPTRRCSSSTFSIKTGDNSLITDENIINLYKERRPDLSDRVVREVWRLLKDYIKHAAKEGKTKIKLSRNLEIFSDYYLKSEEEEYDGEWLQYYMNSLYFPDKDKYDANHLMESKYKEKNLEEIIEDVEKFFENPPFKDKKNKGK